MNSFKEKLLIELLARLSRERRILYCIHTAKRLWPNYIVFQKKEGFEDSALINEIIRAAKSYFDNQISTLRIESLRRKIQDYAPHSEDYPIALAAYAIDAASACYHLLTLLISDDPEAAIWAFRLPINTVSISVAEKMNIPQASINFPVDEIENSAELNEEYNFQENLIKRVTNGEMNELIIEAFDIEYESPIGLIQGNP